MFPKSLQGKCIRIKDNNLIHHIPFHNYHQWRKKKGFLAKLLKTRSNRAFMQMVPPYRQMEGPPMMHQQPPPQQYQQQYQQQYPQQHPQYQPYMQQHPEQMIPPQMYESNETRGGAATTTAASSGIGSFFEFNFESN